MAETNTNTPKKPKVETYPPSESRVASGDTQSIMAENSNTNTPKKKKKAATSLKSTSPQVGQRQINTSTSNDAKAQAAQKATAAALAKATEILRNGGLTQAQAAATAKEVVRHVLREEQAKMNSGTTGGDSNIERKDESETNKKKAETSPPPRASASGKPSQRIMTETSNTNTPKKQPSNSTRVKRNTHQCPSWMKKYARVKASSYKKWKTLIKLNETQPYSIDILDFTDFVEVHGVAAFDSIFPKIDRMGKLHPPPEYLETGAKVREWRQFTNPKQKQEIELIGQRKEKQLVMEERLKDRAERVKNRSTLLSVAESISQMKAVDEGRISQPSPAVAEASIGLASLAVQGQQGRCPGVTLANIRQSALKEDRKALIELGFQHVIRESWQTRYQLTDPKYPVWKRRRAITPNAIITGAIMNQYSTELYWYVEELLAAGDDLVDEEDEGVPNNTSFFEQFVIRDVDCTKSYDPNKTTKSRNKLQLLGCDACVKSCQALFRRCTDIAELHGSSTIATNRFINNVDFGRTNNPRLMKHMIDLQTQELNKLQQLNGKMLAEWRNNQVSSEDDNNVGGVVPTIESKTGEEQRRKKRPLSSVETMDEEEFKKFVTSGPRQNHEE